MDTSKTELNLKVEYFNSVTSDFPCIYILMTNQFDIKKLIKEANNTQFHPSQTAFASAATDFVHHSPPPTTPPTPLTSPLQGGTRYRAGGWGEARQRRGVTGKYKRHRARKARGVKTGFGKGYSAPETVFRVEMNWLDTDTKEETNEQLHWVCCRKFSGKEHNFLKKYFSQNKPVWNGGETVESEFCLRYVACWLIENRDSEHLNQAFIFPSPKIGNDTIRNLLYEVRWLAELPDWKIDEDLAIMIKKNIWHSN